MLAAAVEPNRGWGGPVAILVAITLFFAYTQFRDWRQLRKEIDIPSPTPPWERRRDEDPQVAVGVTDDDTTDDTDEDTVNNFGLRRIRLADGSVLKRRAQAVWRTGSSELPEPDEAAVEPVDDRDGEGEVGGETRADYADRLVAEPIRYSGAVDAIVRAYGVSERTAKRDLAEAARRARA
jgi:hypothetical protein